MTVITSGASDHTARAYGKELRAALIAGIISRDSEAGHSIENTDPPGWGDNYNAFGLMQVDKRWHKPRGAWDSEKHLDQGTGILVDLIKHVQKERPSWTTNWQLKGAIAAYNMGYKVLDHPVHNMEQITTGGDYSSDVVARAQCPVVRGGSSMMGLRLWPGTGQGLAGLQPGPPSSQFDDALSLVASANLFNEVMTEGDASHTLDEASCSSAQGSLQGAADTSMAAILRTALARLQLDAAQTESAQASAFFRRNPGPATFSVPPSEEYLKELHACWRDTRALSHTTSDARTLAGPHAISRACHRLPNSGS
ncbi:unnamed protein product [Boreogadus saida]